jgi:hypothetical protein
MDQAFFLRARRLLDRQPAPPTLPALLEQVAAQRAASPTVTACAQAPAILDTNNQADALAILILGRPGWRVARQIQHGCFNRAAAAHRVNTP